MKIDSIKFLNFKSYAGEQEFCFSDKKTCVILGENGSGKSTIRVGLTYCFFGEAPEITTEDELGYRYDGKTKEWNVDKFGIVVNFTLNGRPYCIERFRNKKKGSLKFYENSSPIKDYTCNGIKETQQKIIEIIGMDYRSFISSTVLTQEEYDKFIKMNPSEAKDVLINILGLDSYETKRLVAAEIVKNAKEVSSVSNISLENLRKNLLQLDTVPDQLKELNKILAINMAELGMAENELEFKQKDHQSLIKASEKINESYENLKRLEKEISQVLNLKRADENSLDRNMSQHGIGESHLKENDLEKSQDSYKGLNIDVEKREKEKSFIENKKFQLSAQIESLRNNYINLDKKKTDSFKDGKSVCLLKRQDCNEAFLKAIEDEMDIITENGKKLSAELSNIEKDLEEMQREFVQIRHMRDWWFGMCCVIPLMDKVKAHKDNIKALEDQKSYFQKQIDENEISLDDVSAKAMEVNGVKSRIEKKRNEAAGLQTEIGRLNAMVEQKKDLEKQIIDNEKTIEDKKKEIAVYEILQKAYSKDGIPALMIERLVPALEVDANDVLRQLSNGSMKIEFYLQKKLKGGGFADGFEIFVTDQDGTRAIRVYSGGEKFRIIFAIHMAFSKYLSYRNGAMIKCLFLDEPASSLDQKGIESFMSCIAAIKNNYDQLFCITHLQELKDYFGDVIFVQKTSTGSFIKGAENAVSKYL